MSCGETQNPRTHTKMNDHLNQQHQQHNALRHCQRIKSVYKECRKKKGNRIHMQSTAIPMELWEAIETMLQDSTISHKNK